MKTEPEILKRAESWLAPHYDAQTRQEVQNIIDQGGEELTEAFYQDLDFGTGGMRGIMGAGTNRVNRYTLGTATQGLCRYLKKQFPGEKHKIVIAHDSRHYSRELSHRVAQVFAANGIKVFLFENLRPTPELSFAIRYLQCHSGVMITASHNPPEYNGYKVYWNDGGQLVPPHDQGVIEEVRQVKPEEVVFNNSSDLIHEIGRRVDLAYLAEVKKLSFSNAGKDDLGIVFTSIHGTSIALLPQALEACGFKNVHIVKEQSTPDGDFPTVKSPNPEEAEALDLALKEAEEKNADLVIGTDPDGDRVGIAVRNLQGELELLNGNQAASVLIYYLLEQWREKGLLTGKEFVAKTIVTTDLIARMAGHYHVHCLECLTGFKWIADMIRKKEGELKFIGGGEESYGYMIGDFVRDKDAIASGTMLAEASAWAKSRGSSLYEMLIDAYHRFGFYLESLVSVKREGRKGVEEIAAMMDSFRTNPPDSLDGEKLVEMLDFKSLQKRNLSTGAISEIDLPQSNVVQLVTESGTKVTARPSGTEPKIKFYISVNARLEDKAQFAEKKDELERRIANIRDSLKL